MHDMVTSTRVRALLALESTATLAGYAMACPFGCSAELEAAIIREKIKAGTYGCNRRRRYVFATAAAIAAVAALLYASN